jgi:hypothetical protein
VLTSPDANDLRKEKMAILRDKFPFTMEYLLGLDGFQTVGRQLSLEGYKDWEIMQAGCNIVMFYRIGTLGRDVTAEELADRAEDYFRNYVESDSSPFPAAETFVLKRVRDQIHGDRLTRMARSEQLRPSTGTAVPIEEVAQHRIPENCIYSKSKDGYHLWKILFPKFDQGTSTVSISEEWHIIIGCASDDSTSFRFSEHLAYDLAKYATMVDWWLATMKSTKKAVLNIAVYEAKKFKKLFPKIYGEFTRTEITNVPLIYSGRSPSGEPHMKLAITETMVQPRTKRLYYAMCGILDSVGGMPKPEAGKKAGELVAQLE